MQGSIRQAVKIICLFFLLWISGKASLALTSASIVICAKTGTVYHEHNADKIIPPASLTKMMTLYLTFKALQEGKLRRDQALLVSRLAMQQEPCKLGLKQGTTITVQQAILGLVTKSANDASVALAEALGKGSESYFAQMMTQQARKLGMASTVFKNSSGLPHKQQVTTARDMAILSRALYLHFPKYCNVFQVQKFVYKGTVHPNHNRLLGKVKGLDGIKTGFTNASGFNLAASMVRDNRRIIAVVLGGESSKARDKKIVRLLEATSAHLTEKQRVLSKKAYETIDDLIFALGSSEESLNPLPSKTKAKLHKAVYLSNTGKIKTIEASYNTVDEILDGIEEKKSPPPSPKKKEEISNKKQTSIKKKSPKKSTHPKPKARKLISQGNKKSSRRHKK